jgi:hypothetical protein
LRNGDRFVIGHYIIVAAVDGEGADASAGLDAQPANTLQNLEDLWSPENGL